MACIFPFQPYRYTAAAGPIEGLVTQPYDKITPEMRARYLGLNSYNLVRIILGERQASDGPAENVYTRAAEHLRSWIARGILARDAAPALFPYFQEFTVPDTGEKLVRKGFIGLGAVEDYSAGIVHRHEQTLAGPKKDRLELLRHTRAHFGQIFMCYPDPACEVDRLIDEAAHAEPLAQVTDEYGAVHLLWRMADAERIRAIQQLMSDKKLLIADGHHRYETALAYRDENPDLPGARKVMMTFVNMHARGLQILATHRLVSGVETGGFLERAGAEFRVQEVDSPERLRAAWAQGADRTVIGAAVGDRLYLLERRGAESELDVKVLHGLLLGRVLNIGEDAVREERNLRYARGMDAAIAQARSGAAQIAFLLKPVSIEEVARVSFSGGVMPQKSTDFYPKLLSGLTIYKVDE